ncbi:MAG: hypothetical protein ACTSP6_08635 [Promethearchaeota archaeon]
MNNTIDSINQIKLIVKKDKINKILIMVPDDWKYKFYSSLISLIDKTKDQGEIMKKIMQEKQFKPHGKIIGQTVAKILKNVGKFSKSILSPKDEFDFFNEIKFIIEKKYNCTSEIIIEKDSKESKAIQALPGRPALIIS